MKYQSAQEYIVWSIPVLVTACFIVIRNVKKGWQNRTEKRLKLEQRVKNNSTVLKDQAQTIVKHTDMMTSQGQQLATITANMKHIKDTGDETRDDVKKLLRSTSDA